MRYRHVCVAALTHALPPHVVTSDEIERRLAPLYERLGLPFGRLELMTGIRERRFFDRDTRPGEISAQTAMRAIEASGLDRRFFGALVHGSVCRDQMEPATAAAVHHAASLPGEALVLDVSNACLGLINGMLVVADLIELGRIRGGVVVGTEIGRPLLEGTIDWLLSDPAINRRDVKTAFASLTIGSGSAAVVLCDRKLSPAAARLRGAAFAAETAAHELCAGGVDAESHADGRPRMSTDSEALLHAGVDLAEKLWPRFLRTVGWAQQDVDRVFTHQVGRVHRRLLLERLSIEAEKDLPTVEFLGNTGAAALPTALSLGIEQGRLSAGDRVALLGIGSGLSAIMVALDY